MHLPLSSPLPYTFIQVALLLSIQHPGEVLQMFLLARRLVVVGISLLQWGLSKGLKPLSRSEEFLIDTVNNIAQTRIIDPGGVFFSFLSIKITLLYLLTKNTERKNRNLIQTFFFKMLTLIRNPT